MNVAEYLNHSGMSPQELGGKLALTDEAIRRYMIGERRPRREIAERLIEISGGKITWESLYATKTKLPRRRRPSKPKKNGGQNAQK